MLIGLPRVEIRTRSSLVIYGVLPPVTQIVIAHAERGSFERSARLDSVPGYTIVDPAEAGGVSPSPDREVYYPVLYTASADDGSFSVGGTTNGHVVKYVSFIGKAAHAGAAPHRGINALQAAMIALNAIPYVVEAAPGPDGTPRPSHIKERVRALGPTVRPDLTLKPADPEIGNWVI